MSCDGDYSQYVCHPRFGQAPRFTGLDPDPDAAGVHLHWNTRLVTPRQKAEMERLLGWSPPAFPNDGTRLVPGTAIAADVSRQVPSTVPVTHYYDIDKICRDCGLRFIFYAEEQKFWYEELAFRLEVDAVRCQICRRRQQQISRTKKRYEELSQIADRSGDEELEMAESCLYLIEERVFHVRQLSHVRQMKNRIPEPDRNNAAFQRISDRLTDVSRRLE